ncbi:MAG: response regulator transcription factor [Treponema sp.]|nr:response regulator transcription factor [Candidatus Treponema equifaecale]
MKKIMLVDDHQMIKLGLKTFIEENSDFCVSKMTSTVPETLDYLENCQKQNETLPDAIIFDIQLEEEMSFDLIKTVSQNFPEIKSVVYSMFDSTGFQLLAKDCGAVAYVSKTSSGKNLIDALEKVFNGEEFFESESREKLTKLAQVTLVLTNKEKQIFEYILMGKNNLEITKLMKVKLNTVEKYISSIYEKLGVRYREEILEKYK